MGLRYPSAPAKKMKYTRIKNTEIHQASRLCYGTGPLRYQSPQILVTAFQKYGINFWDTADCYGTQKIIGKALKKIGRENIIVMTKIDSKTEKEAEKEIQKSLKEMQTKYIDVVLLHGIGNVADFSRRKPALKVLLKYKAKGTIKAVGFSTHSSPRVVEKAPEEIDIILASINEARIDRGTKEEMMAALEKQKHKGIVAMKIFGAGRHVHEFKKRMDFPLKYRFIDAINIGMRNLKEVRQNSEYVYKHY